MSGVVLRYTAALSTVNYHMKWEQVKGTFLLFLHIYKWS